MCTINNSEIYKKAKYINKLGIVFINQNFCKKSFDSNADS